MRPIPFKLFSAVPLFLVLAFSTANAAVPSLFLDTDYRLRGVNYNNLDFDQTSSTDSKSYYDQRLSVALTGKFVNGIEIGTKFTAIGVAGSTTTPFAVPYPSTDFTPFVEHAYVRMNNLVDIPVAKSARRLQFDLVAGRQALEYGKGLVVSDNDAGINTVKVVGRYDVPIPFSSIFLPLQGELFTGTVKDNLKPGSDQDINGAVFNFALSSSTAKSSSIELAYFSENDGSGTPYTRGAITSTTRSIRKNFYDLRYSMKEENIASADIELVKQTGQVDGFFIDPATNLPRNYDIGFDAFAYVLSGSLTSDKTKIGKVTAHGLVAVFSGDDNPAVFETNTDNTFSPDLTRRFDGLERTGYGRLFAATPAGSALQIPAEFSGIDTLNIGVDVSPLYNLNMGIDYFLFAASQGPKGAPEASGFEQFYGAQFSLGAEVDFAIRYIFNKYVDTGLAYCLYTPPSGQPFWPKSDAATLYELEIRARF